MRLLPLRNTDKCFGSVSITLHWLAAGATLLMLATALPMYLYRGDHARRLPFIYLHSSMGITLAVILLVRVAWHFVARQPARLSSSAWLRTLAGVVHAALLALITAQVVTGPVDVWSGGFALRIFDFAAIASPFGAGAQAWHEAIGDFHAWCGLAVALLIAVHLTGVAKHVFYDHDRTLPRMLGQMESDR